MVKRRCNAAPIFALFLALGALCGIVTVFYDHYSHQRTLREIHSIAGFAKQLHAVGKVIDA